MLLLLDMQGCSKWKERALQMRNKTKMSKNGWEVGVGEQSFSEPSRSTAEHFEEEKGVCYTVFFWRLFLLHSHGHLRAL